MAMVALMSISVMFEKIPKCGEEYFEGLDVTVCIAFEKYITKQVDLLIVMTFDDDTKLLIPSCRTARGKSFAHFRTHLMSFHGRF